MQMLDKSISFNRYRPFDWSRLRAPTSLDGSSLWWELFAGVAYVAFVLGALALILSHENPERAGAFFGTIGAIAIWRYSWWIAHVARAFVYLKRSFPKMRRAADNGQASKKVDHVYAIVMSYKIEPKQFYQVYDSLIKNAMAYGVPTTIVASITTDTDRWILRRVLVENGSPENIQIVAQFQQGDGKRSALGMALRCIARRAPPTNSVVVLMDGDILLQPSALSRSISFFSADPKVGAVTTNNDAIVDGSFHTKKWYTLRFAQRNILMASMALSSRLLVLTGRFSIFRSADATHTEFINLVENDAINHWRFGKFRFVSGDDKSTWFFLMRRNVRMIYIPDVVAYGFEALPDQTRFFASTTSLFTRWFGNMLRTNGRAIKLGPRTCGYFVWWSLVDQRISMWTSLIGPTITLMFSVFVSPIYLVFYALWVAITRLVMSAVTGIGYRQFSMVWPYLLYYNQVWGAVLKTYMSFRLNRQGWTRQRIGVSNRRNFAERWANRTLHIAALFIFIYCIGLATGQISLVDRDGMSVFLAAFTDQGM